MSDRQPALQHAGASIHRIASAELLERLSYFALQPQCILDLGTGLHAAAGTLQQRFERAQIIAVDPSIEALGRPLPGGWFRRRAPHRIGARMSSLPLQDGCTDLVLSHLLLPAHSPVDRVLREIARVLRPGGVLLFSSLGPASRLESQTSEWSLSALPDLPDWGELLIGTGFAEPVMDVERHHVSYPNAAALRADLNGLRTDASSAGSEATYELITGAAFAGTRHSATIGTGAIGEAAIPVNSIRHRKR